MNRDIVGGRFFQTLNSLAADPLTDLISETSVMRIGGHVKVGRPEIVEYFRSWLAPTENLQIHIVSTAVNDYAIWYETNIMPYGSDDYDCMWILNFDFDNKIKFIRIFTDKS
jgi:hypothetical protein